MKKNTNRRIDNAPYYNDSLAYDFEMFMPREKKEKSTTEQIIKNKPKLQPKHKIDTVVICLGFLCFVLMILSLFVRVEISETCHQIQQLEKEVAALESEHTRLMCEYASITSYANLEEEATKLGMRKMTKDQVVYIRIHTEDKVILKNGDQIERVDNSEGG